MVAGSGEMTGRDPGGAEAPPETADALAGRNLLAAVHMLSNRIGRAFDPELQGRFGVGVPEWRVVLMLAQRPGASMAEISDLWAMDKMTVSRAVARLEAAGRVRRSRSAADRRRFELELTAAGRTLYAEIEPSATARYRDILAALDEAEKAQLATLLGKLLARTTGRPE